MLPSRFAASTQYTPSKVAGKSSTIQSPAASPIEMSARAALSDAFNKSRYVARLEPPLSEATVAWSSMMAVAAPKQSTTCLSISLHAAFVAAPENQRWYGASL